MNPAVRKLVRREVKFKDRPGVITTTTRGNPKVEEGEVWDDNY